MHFTSDNKLNTVHDINKYVKSGPMINISKSKKNFNYCRKYSWRKSQSKKH